MLRTHRSLKDYCATLWWRWSFFIFHFNRAPVEWNWQGKTEVLGEEPVPVPLCPPQIPHGPTRDFFFLWSILYCLNPSVLHVTLRSILLSLYNKHNTDIHAPGGIRTHKPSNRAAVDPRLRPRGRWDRRDRTRASAVRGRRLTASAMARS
jgi:hypothetical protein